MYRCINWRDRQLLTFSYIRTTHFLSWYNTNILSRNEFESRGPGGNMSRKKTKVHAIIGVGAILATTSVSASYMTSHDVKVVPGEVIVKVKEGQEGNFLHKNGIMGLNVAREVKLSDSTLYVVKTSTDNASFISGLQAINAMDEVEYAEPNFIYNLIEPVEKLSFEKILDSLNENPIASTPNDPSFGKLWGLHNTGLNDPGGATGQIEGFDIDALSAWEITKGLKSVKIAVIDTEVDYNHPDLADNMWVNEAEANGKEGVDDDENGFVDDIHGYDFANNDGDPLDGHGHGTHCSGTIGAIHDNEVGVAGVMGDVTIVALKFLTDSGSGTSEGAIQAIDYATKLGVDVMSNSWGGGPYSQILEDTIKKASDAGIVFVAAAGNDSSNNDSKPMYPASYDVPNVISIAASNSKRGLAYFSSYGKKSVDVAAPGMNIYSTVKNAGYDSFSGTSMATPHIAGMIGALISHVGRTDHDVMRERLLKTSVPIRDFKSKMVSGGHANLYNLLTDTRPERHEPDPTKWVTMQMDEVFESDHPYGHGKLETVEINVPGAKWLRVRIKKFELEKKFDFLSILDGEGTVAEKIDGAGENFVTEYVEGETLKIEFKSDKSVNKWGFVIEEYDVITD